MEMKEGGATTIFIIILDVDYHACHVMRLDKSTLSTLDSHQGGKRDKLKE